LNTDRGILRDGEELVLRKLLSLFLMFVDEYDVDIGTPNLTITEFFEAKDREISDIVKVLKLHTDWDWDSGS